MARKASSEKTEKSGFEKYADTAWTLSADDSEKVKSYIETGSVILDALVTGDGKGIPAGASVCISSEPSCGKSTIALGIARKVCLSGKKVIYFDVENAVTEYQLKAFRLQEFLGKSFFIFDKQTFEEVEEVLADLIYEKDLGCVFIDSITSLSSNRDIDLEETITGGEIASQARLIGKFVKKFRYHSRRAGVALIYINQMRTKDIGARTGAKLKPAGGYPQEHNMDVHIQINHGEKLYRSEETALGKQDKVIYGEDLRVKCLKNKYCRSGIELVLTLIIGQGVSNYAAYTKWLMNHGDIKQSGPYYTITIGDTQNKVQGQIAVNAFLKAHADEVRKYIDSNGGFFLVKNESNCEDEENECETKNNSCKETQNVSEEVEAIE